MMQFAQYLASTYGSSLKELIYTPLGYSVKDGQIVPPYAQNSHYNHVHVAYAKGPGTPAFFSNKKDAVSWENKFLGKGVKSITTNTAELSKLARNAGPSTPVKFDETMRQFVPNPGAGRPGEVRLKPPMTPQARGETSVVNNFTITQQPGEDGEALANRVATLFYDAMNNAQSASIFG
jgi:hypothetical protein